MAYQRPTGAEVMRKVRRMEDAGDSPEKIQRWLDTYVNGSGTHGTIEADILKSIPRAIGSTALMFAQGGANLAAAGARHFNPKYAEAWDRVAEGASQRRATLERVLRPRSTTGQVVALGTDIAANVAPYVLAPQVAIPMAVTQAMASRDDSAVGGFANLTGSQTLSDIADNPASRVAFDVALEALGTAAGLRRMKRMARGATPVVEAATTTPVAAGVPAPSSRTPLRDVFHPSLDDLFQSQGAPAARPPRPRRAAKTSAVPPTTPVAAPPAAAAAAPPAARRPTQAQRTNRKAAQTTRAAAEALDLTGAPEEVARLRQEAAERIRPISAPDEMTKDAYEAAVRVMGKEEADRIFPGMGQTASRVSEAPPVPAAKKTVRRPGGAKAVAQEPAVIAAKEGKLHPVGDIPETVDMSGLKATPLGHSRGFLYTTNGKDIYRRPRTAGGWAEYGGWRWEAVDNPANRKALQQLQEAAIYDEMPEIVDAMKATSALKKTVRRPGGAKAAVSSTEASSVPSRIEIRPQTGARKVGIPLGESKEMLYATDGQTLYSRFKILGDWSDSEGQWSWIGRDTAARRSKLLGKDPDTHLFDVPLPGTTPSLRPGVISTQLAGDIAGAGTGGLVGASQGETPEEKLMLGLTGAAAGFGVSRAAGDLLRNAGRGVPPAAGGEVPASTSRLLEPAKPVGPIASDYERALAEGTIGTPKLDESPFIPSLKKVPGYDDPALEGAAVLAGQARRKVTRRELLTVAKGLDIDIEALDAAKISRLDSKQWTQIGKKLGDINTELADVYGRLERATAEELPRLNDQFDTLWNKRLQAAAFVTRAGGEQGRGMNAIKSVAKLAAGRGTPEAAMLAARKLLGAEALAPKTQEMLRDAMKAAAGLPVQEREKLVARTLSKLVEMPWHKSALGLRRVGMLTMPATWMVNLTGNISAVTEELVTTRPALALDMLLNGERDFGKVGTVARAGRKAFWSGAKKSAKETMERPFMESVAKVKKTITDLPKHDNIDLMEHSPLEGLSQNNVDFTRDLGAASGTAVGKAAQGVSNVVYGVMTAADRPFYNAFRRASLAKRAAVRAMDEGLVEGTEEFAARMAKLTELDAFGDASNMSKVDDLMSHWEAAEATFKTPTPMSTKLVRMGGPVGELVVPFVRTPVNLVRKGLEAIPLVGSGFNVHTRRILAEKLRHAGVKETEIARELRRVTAGNLTKQLTTGGGMIGAGFLLSSAGLLTSEYIENTSRNEAERDDADVAKLRQQPQLTLRVGGKAYSLAGFGQFAALLALGHALQLQSAADEKEGKTISLGGLAKAGASGVLRQTGELPLLSGLRDVTDFTLGKNRSEAAGRMVASIIPSAAAGVARATDPVQTREVTGFWGAIKDRVPGDWWGGRESLPPQVGLMGEVQPRTSALSIMASPFRERNVNSGPLYDALEALEAIPPTRQRWRGHDESDAEYAARSQAEGEVERELIERILSNPQSAPMYAGRESRRQFYQDHDFSALIQDIIRKHRTATTAARERALPPHRHPQ